MIPSIRSDQPMSVGTPHGAYHGVVLRRADVPVALYYPGAAKIEGDRLTRHEYRPTLLTIGEAQQTAERMAHEADLRVKLPDDPFEMRAKRVKHDR